MANGQAERCAAKVDGKKKLSAKLLGDEVGSGAKRAKVGHKITNVLGSSERKILYLRSVRPHRTSGSGASHCVLRTAP